MRRLKTSQIILKSFEIFGYKDKGFVPGEYNGENYDKIVLAPSVCG